MRKLFCRPCGAAKPTHPEDAARGLYERRVFGKLLRRSLTCDTCGTDLSEGDEVTAVSLPSDMREWEPEYIAVE